MSLVHYGDGLSHHQGGKMGARIAANVSTAYPKKEAANSDNTKLAACVNPPMGRLMSGDYGNCRLRRARLC
jgi:hypothetical protein